MPARSPIYTVFLSSTFRDLESERDRVSRALLNRRCMPLGMEHFRSAPFPAWSTIREELERASACVVLVAGRYGEIDEATDLSWTHREYRTARALGIPTIAAIHKSPDKLPAASRDADATARMRRESFCDELRSDLTPGYFGDVAELIEVVTNGVERLVEDRVLDRWVRRPATGRAQSRAGSAPEQLDADRDELTQLLSHRYGAGSALDAQAYSLLSPRVPYLNCLVRIWVDVDAAGRPWQVTTQSFEAELDDEYVVAFSASREATNVILTECPRVHDVVSLPDSEHLPAPRELTTRVRVEVGSLTAAQRTAYTEVELEPLTDAMKDERLHELDDALRPLVAVGRIALATGRRNARLRVELRSPLGREALYCYWRSDRVMQLRELHFDLRAIPKEPSKLGPSRRDGSLHALMFMGAATVEAKTEDEAHVWLEPDEWVLPGQGALVAFAGAPAHARP